MKNIKKIAALFIALAVAVSLSACGGEKEKNQNGSASANGEISVFYYTFSDPYISSVRAAADKILKASSVKYQNYDANANQTTQTEQVQTAIAKGSKALVVNVVDTGSNDAAQTIVELARQKDIPVVFFNRSVDESVITSYDRAAFVGTDYEMAGHMQGKMIGEYLVANYDKVDLNGDGKISYVMFKGQEGNMEAIARTRFGVEDCNKVLREAGKPEIEFYDSSNSNKYLVDQNGLWSSASATDYMNTILAKHSTANKNMVELVIANNDEMAIGAVSALQTAGYNKSGGTVIPVFGVDATDSAKDAVAQGSMTGTIKQNAEAMADVITTVTKNMMDGKSAFDGVAADQVVGKWRVNIPYEVYTGDKS